GTILHGLSHHALRRQPASPVFPYTTLFRSQVLLRQHHAFGETRRAAGVGQGHEILGPVQRGLRWVFGGGLAEQITEEIRPRFGRSEEHTSELQSRGHLVCRLLLEKKKPPEK